MQIRNVRSIIVILVYVALNLVIIVSSFQETTALTSRKTGAKTLAPEYTLIENLDYFHLKKSIPQMSLSATQMRSQGEEFAEFILPKGLYNHGDKNETLRYQAENGVYRKEKDLLSLRGGVKVNATDAQYTADVVNYFFKQDLVLASGNVSFVGDDPKTKDHFTVKSQAMKAHPGNRDAIFTGNVKGRMERKKKYEGRMDFSSQTMNLDGRKSMAHLEGDVKITREGHLITAGKADIFLDNYNKSLKYFVLNDDVKVTETLKTPTGVTERKAFSERLEGFGREQKMVLSGAPRVEQGTDVIKGYRITIRENAELIEVDDAMPEVQVKREEKVKE